MNQRDLIRFLAKVDQYELVDHCWIWQANKFWTGYGQFKDKGKVWLAHRWIYTYFFGAIEPRLQIDHLCRIKLCVNPQHLEAVTNTENTFRAELFWRMKTHCKYGHEFSEKNTYLRKAPNGLVKRGCRICSQKRKR